MEIRKYQRDLKRVRTDSQSDQLSDLAEGTGRYWMKCQCGRHYLTGTEYVHFNTEFHKGTVK